MTASISKLGVLPKSLVPSNRCAVLREACLKKRNTSPSDLTNDRSVLLVRLSHSIPTQEREALTDSVAYTRLVRAA